MDEERKNSRRVLLVEDDEQVMASLVRIVTRYEGEVVPLLARDAGEALRALRSRDATPIDAMILDLMMPYGDAFIELDGSTDPELVDSGVRLLELLRNEEAGRDPLWVGVVTARIQHSVLRRVESLLGERGQLFLKPFSTFQLQHQLACALGIDSRVPAVLLP